MIIRLSKMFLLFGFLLSIETSFANITPELKSSIRIHLSRVDKSDQLQEDFRRAYRFFIQDEYDSVIVYTAKYQSFKHRRTKLVDFTNFMRAISYYEKRLIKPSKANFEKISPSFPMLPAVRMYQASIYLILNSYDKALKLFLEVESKSNLLQYGIAESSITHNIGLCYMYLDQNDLAETYMLKGLEQQIYDKDTARIISSYTDLANLYYNQYLDSLAIPYFERAYIMAKQTSEFNLLASTTLNMAVVEENREDLATSLEYRKEYERWKDSASSERKQLGLIELEKANLARDKQKEIGLLERENALKARERNIILIGVFVLIGILVLIIYLYWQKIRTNRIVASQRESLDRLNDFKNRLFSIVSHDLRSSVNGLRRSTENLRSHVSEDDTELKNLIHQQGAIANSTFGMLDNLLNWALLQSDQLYFHKEKIALHRVVPQVAANYEPLLLQKKISLITDVSTKARVSADLDTLKIVLRNVLDNAIKFTPEGGSINITTTELDKTCSITITDSGPGMTDEQLQSVLHDSHQASKESKNDASNTGLGVRLCVSFVEKNDGVFEMSSTLGKGTSVNITLLKFE